MQFLVGFFAKEIEPHFYNGGLANAHVFLFEKAEEIGYSIQELEKPAI